MKKPNTGEHWMVRSTKSLRYGFMRKTHSGWSSIFDSNGNTLDTFTRRDTTFEPILYAESLF